MANEVILKNVKLRWAYLDKPQTQGEFASNKYQVDVVLDAESKKAVERMKSSRQKFKEKDGDTLITLKSSVKPHVYVVDKGVKRLMTDDELRSIGNDTVAHVKVNQYNTQKFGTFAGLGAVKIVSLKQYTGDDDFGDDDDVPFVADEGSDEDLI
jgi:hypothetical protein